MLLILLSLLTVVTANTFAGGLPLQGSALAPEWDFLYDFLVWTSLFFFVLVVGGMLWFAFAYKNKPGRRAKYLTGSHSAEALFLLIPTILVFIFFGWGYYIYNKMTEAPSNAIEIKVVGKKWSWAFQYEDGRVTNNEVFVPLNQPVRFLMSSEDVLHSMFIPNFRVKQDVVPGLYTSIWFEATVPGKHQIFCTEYCGAGHSTMLGQVVVLTDKQWTDWQRGREIGTIGRAGGEVPANGITLSRGGGEEKAPAGPSLAQQGKELVAAKGCIACHTSDGSKSIAPSFKGVFGHKVELADGSSVKADENYIHESIMNPTAKVVKGFQPVMPPYQGQLKEEEINAIIAYIKSLK